MKKMKKQKEEIIKENEYKCALCNKVYQKGRSDEEAEKEVKDIWGEIPKEERAIICDDCFKKRTKNEIRKMGNVIKKFIEREKIWANGENPQCEVDFNENTVNTKDTKDNLARNN